MGCAIGRKVGIIRLVSTNCSACNKAFKVYPSDLRTRHKVTCSKECSRKWHSIRLNSGKFSVGHKKIAGFNKGDKHKEQTKLKMRGKRKTPNRIYKHIANNDALAKWRLNGGIPWHKGKKRLEMTGPKHPNWKGGFSVAIYPEGFNMKLKKEIKEFYNYRCQICFMKEKYLEHKLRIHHIDYVKENISYGNLIPLCISCHAVTNYKREYWEKCLSRN